jgi:hypothetical protein
MPIALCTDTKTLVAQAKALAGDGIAMLLTGEGESTLTAPLQEVLPDLVVLEAGSPRFARLNFDAVTLLVADLDAAFLQGSAGRRLFDALGRLAAEELMLAFCGAAGASAGGVLHDGLHAGLGLVPHTVVLPDLHAVPDLRGLLAQLSERRIRLLALDAPACAVYDPARDEVAAHGAGSVLLAAFVAGADESPPTARLHVLTDGTRAGWPE